MNNKLPTATAMNQYIADLLHNEMQVYGGELRHSDRLLGIMCLQLFRIAQTLERIENSIDTIGGIESGI
jgi:hypothetical protein